jgi:hypothetical protein
VLVGGRLGSRAGADKVVATKVAACIGNSISVVKVTLVSNIARL